jgi:hypothetical protein
MTELYWHCLQCGDNHPVEPTGGPLEEDYVSGDKEPCECGGTSHVMTVQRAAAYEQGRALGMTLNDAWKRAQTLTKETT